MYFLRAVLTSMLLAGMADAAEAALTASQEKLVEQLIAQLGDEAFDRREAATAELLRQPDTVKPLLDKALKSALTQEERRRLQFLVDRFSPGGEIWRRTLHADGVPGMLVSERFAVFGWLLLDKATGMNLDPKNFGFPDQAVLRRLMPDGRILCERADPEGKFELGAYDPAMGKMAWWSDRPYARLERLLHYSSTFGGGQFAGLVYEVDAKGYALAPIGKKFTLNAMDLSTGREAWRAPMPMSSAPAGKTAIPERGWEDIGRLGGFEDLSHAGEAGVVFMNGRRLFPGPGKEDYGYWSARVRAFDAKNGSPLWDETIPNLFGARLSCDAKSRRYFLAGKWAASETRREARNVQVICCGDLATGKQIWRHEEDGGYFSTTAAAADDLLLAPLFRLRPGADMEVRLLCFEQATGKLRWRKDAPFKTASMAPAPIVFGVKNGRVSLFVFDGASTLAYVDLKTGAMVKGPTVPKAPLVWTDTELFTGGGLSAADEGYLPAVKGADAQWSGSIPCGGSIYRLRPWPAPETLGEKK